MAVKYDIVATIGEYTNSSGETKKRYTKLGVIIETVKNGLALKIESIPVGWDGFAYLNTPKERDTTTGGNAPRSTPQDDDIPF